MITYDEPIVLFSTNVGPVFTKDSLEETCDELARRNVSNGHMNWVWNAHRLPLGIGNYDVNALTMALQQTGKENRGQVATCAKGSGVEPLCVCV